MFQTDPTIIVIVGVALLIADVVKGVFLYRQNRRIGVLEGVVKDDKETRELTHKNAALIQDTARTVAKLAKTVELQGKEVKATRDLSNSNLGKILNAVHKSKDETLEVIRKEFYPKAELKAMINDLYRRTESGGGEP